MAASSSSQLSTPNYVSVASGSSGSGAGHSRPISALKFSHDGRLLASASADASVRIYRVINDAAGVAGGASVVPSTSDAVAAPAPAAPAPLQSLSPRPRLELACELPGAHELGINDLVFSHDNRYLITASDDKNIIVWEIEDSNSSTLAAPTANNSNGNSNSGNGSLTVRPLRTLIGHTSYVFCLSVSGAGNLLASGSYDETVRLWDLKNGRCLRCIKAHSDPVSAVDFNRDGTLVVSSSYDGLCRVWETASGRCLKTIYNEKSQAPVSFVRFSPNGKYILAASLDSTLRLWDYQQKESE
jgi:COMPASS component SWD3